MRDKPTRSEGRSCKSWVTGASSRKRAPLKDDHFGEYSTTVLGGETAELTDIMFIWRLVAKDTQGDSRCHLTTTTKLIYRIEGQL